MTVIMKFGGQEASSAAAEVLACIDRHDFERAGALAQSALERDPHDYALQLAHAQLSLVTGDFVQARERFARVRELFPARTGGHVGGALACLASGDTRNAGNFCQQAIHVITRDSRAGLEQYYQLAETCLRVPGLEDSCVRMFTLLEERDRSVSSDSRYYFLLFSFAWPLIARMSEDSGHEAVDFALLRLLRQPPAGAGVLLGLNLLYSSICSNAHDRLELLGQMIDRLVDINDLDSPLAVMASSESSDEQCTEVLERLLRQGLGVYCVKLCIFQERSQALLAAACRSLLGQRRWLRGRGEEIYTLVRTANFADQDLGDEAAAAVHERYHERGLGVSDPVGALCSRHEQRQALLAASRALPERGAGARLRIAVCISGQLRGYHGPFEELQKALGLGHHECRVFVHTWDRIGVVFNPARVLSAKRSLYGAFLKAFVRCFEHMEQPETYLPVHYPAFYALISDTGRADPSELSEYYATPDVIIEDGEEQRFAGWSSSQRMHYKFWAAHQQVVDSGEDFDLEIRCRPDLRIVKKDDVDLAWVYARSREHASVLTCRGLNRFTTHLSLDCGYSVDDSFAMGTPLAMGVYCSTYPDLAVHMRRGTYGCPGEFKGHITLEHNLYAHGVHLDEYRGICSVMELSRPPYRNPRIPVSMIYEALRRDVASREPCEHDQTLLSACREQLHLPQEDAVPAAEG